MKTMRSHISVLMIVCAFLGCAGKSHENANSSCNTYVYGKNGKLERITHDTTQIQVAGYHEHVSWKSDIFFINPLAKRADSMLHLACVFRNFKDVSAQLNVSILKNGTNWFDTTYQFIAISEDNYPDGAIIFHKKVPATEGFTCIARYKLMDRCSKAFVTEDTSGISLIFR
jgi:hypothetical protein